MEPIRYVIWKFNLKYVCGPNSNYHLYTVSAPLKLQGSIFQNEFLGGVLLIFNLPGVVIEIGLYLLQQNIINKNYHGTNADASIGFIILVSGYLWLILITLF